MVPLKGCVHHSCRETLCHLLPFSACLLKMDFEWVQRKVHVFLTWGKETPWTQTGFQTCWPLRLMSAADPTFYVQSAVLNLQSHFRAQAVPPGTIGHLPLAEVRSPIYHCTCMHESLPCLPSSTMLGNLSLNSVVKEISPVTMLLVALKQVYRLRESTWHASWKRSNKK